MSNIFFENQIMVGTDVCPDFQVPPLAAAVIGSVVGSVVGSVAGTVVAYAISE